MAVKKQINDNKGGRPTKYKEDYCDDIIKYFDIEPTRTITERFFYKNGDEKEKEIEVANELPTIEGFCRTIKINKSTLHEWVKAHKEFSNAYNVAKDLQVDLWLKNSLKGLYNPTFSIFAGKNMFGWRDKQEFDHTSKGHQITYSDEQINAIIDRYNRSRKK
ncbi:MAG: hypothetical protein HY959_03770 [Ignavibacteriae bacterium]|nr:hypothetical protein [Ignavibacteriota bacterium]